MSPADSSPRQTPPASRRSLAVCVLLAAVALALLGIAAVSLPAPVRKPILMPLALFGLGGGLIVSGLSRLFEVALPVLVLIAVLAVGPLAYAVAGTRALDAAFNERDRRRDPMEQLLLEQLRNDPTPIAQEMTERIDQGLGLPRWAAWRWDATPLGTRRLLATLVYAAEAAAAVALGVVFARPVQQHAERLSSHEDGHSV